MIDPHIWSVLEQAFPPNQIWEMRELLDFASSIGGWDLDVIPQTMYDNELCALCATFYSREVAELWISKSGKPGSGSLYKGSNPKGGYRVCIDFPVLESNPFWPGW